jgi:hypothetical protein
MDHAHMTAHMQSMPGHRNMKKQHEADLRKLQAARGREYVLLSNIKRQLLSASSL